MITKTRIADLRKLAGAGWVTALKAPDIAALAADGGPLQLSLFDEQNLAEISHPDYPGERLVCCRNPALAESRRLKREALLAATEADLEKIRKSAAAGRLKDKDKIGVRVGKVIGKHKVGKHFTWDITGDGFTFRRDEEKIAAEARLDGIYVIRTTMTADTADAPGVVRTYKNLKYVERDFKTIKIDDLDIRPIRHYLAGRVEAHLLICMLAAYLTWHLRKAFAPLTFTDEDIPEPADPVIPPGARPGPRYKTLLRKHPTACRFTATATCWSTWRPWTGKLSISPGSGAVDRDDQPRGAHGDGHLEAEGEHERGDDDEAAAHAEEAGEQADPGDRGGDLQALADRRGAARTLPCGGPRRRLYRDRRLVQGGDDGPAAGD